MRFKFISEHWLGIITALSGIVASLWLGITGRLVLYIHPRYSIFTVTMCILALAMLIVGFWKEHKVIFMQRQKAGTVVLGGLCLLIATGMLITKPAVLTSTTASQRGINTAALDLSAKSPLTEGSKNADYRRFTVKEWASLLAQTSDPNFYKGKQVDVSGFISPAGLSNEVFYVSRFVISCCAVDARPVGVPVYLPNWRSNHKPDNWVHVTGVFTANPAGGEPALAISGASITIINQPDDPYVH